MALVLLVFLSILYRLGHRMRLFLYRRGLRRQIRLKARVISVGNITVGGTGKTPLVIYLAEKLRAQGEKVAVLTRGYRREKKKMLDLTQPARDEFDWRDAGDEPCLLANRLQDVPIIVTKDRFASGNHAIEKHGARILILDDGFQHLRLTRQTDIVVIDSTNPFGNRRLLPAGPLREPLSSLMRADIFVLTKTDQTADKEALVAMLKRYNPEAPLVESVYQVRSIQRLSDGSPVQVDEVENKKALIFSGIGNPLSFENTIKQLGIQILRHHKFPDHFAYQGKDILGLGREAENLGAELIITTEKDSVRIPLIKEPEIPIYVLKIDLKVTSGEEVLLQKAKGKL